jgi:hypothetical protein
LLTNAHQDSDRFQISRAQGELETILGAAYANDMIRRALLEKVMRRLVFQHKTKFPQLKSTPVVKAWERVTGQQW